MNLQSLWINPFSKSRQSVDSDHSFLSTVDVFESLNDRQIKKIMTMLHIRHYESGELIFRQGDPGVGMYIIRSGCVDVYHEYVDLTRKKIAVLSEGDFFGEMSLLNDAPRSATSVSTHESTLFGLFKPDLLEIMDEDPSLGLKFIYRVAQIIAERLRITTLEAAG